jgi:hypothetical protein
MKALIVLLSAVMALSAHAEISEESPEQVPSAPAESLPKSLPPAKVKKSPIVAGKAVARAKKSAPDKNEQADDTSAPDVTDSSSGDTYNFYFQKAPGGNDVQQGKEQVVTPHEAKPEVQHERETAPQRREESHAEAPSHSSSQSDFEPLKEDAKTNLYAGTIFVPARSGHGYLIGAQYNPVPFLGFHFDYMSFNYDGGGILDDHGFSSSGSLITGSSAQASGGSFAVSFAPFATSIRPSVRFQTLLGLMFLSDNVTSSSSSFSGDGNSIDKHSLFLPYFGVEAVLNLNRVIGISGYGKLTADPEFSQFGLNLVWSL